MNPKQQQEALASDIDPRHIVTEKAFQVHPRLLGKPLAGPWRRLFGICIDGLVVVTLSNLGESYQLTVAGILLWWLGRALYGRHKRPKLSRTLRIIGPIICLIGALALVGGDWQWFMPSLQQKSEQLEQALQQQPVQPSDRTEAAQTDISKDPSTMTEDEKNAELAKQWQQALKQVAEQQKQEANENDEQQGAAHSVIAWIKGILSDLGIGFGWAAFYFTILTSLTQGQTLGKKLLGMRVIRLDGRYLTLWDAFGRYGGYGAGIATGLLGFLQIFWDPNRQPIHDKISSTVVVLSDRQAKQVDLTEE